MIFVIVARCDMVEGHQQFGGVGHVDSILRCAAAVLPGYLVSYSRTPHYISRHESRQATNILLNSAVEFTKWMVLLV